MTKFRERGLDDENFFDELWAKRFRFGGLSPEINQRLMTNNVDFQKAGLFKV